jgi:hypothetical protein
MVEGEILVDEFALARVDAREIALTARAEAKSLASRAGI